MPQRRRATVLVLLLGLWLVGQGAHDLLVHAGEWSHGGGTAHGVCSLFQGLHQIEWTGTDAPTPDVTQPGRRVPASAAAPSLSCPGRVASRAPPLPT